MDLYILRHGIAEDASKTGHDKDRVLTGEGIERTRAAGKALRKMEVEFDMILSSSYIRTRQTAEALVEEMEYPGEIVLVEGFASGATPERMLPELMKHCRKQSSILIVGHEPDLSRLISVLLSGTTQLSVTMKKGALCKLACVRPEPGAARLEWLLGPKHLCRMA